MIMDRISIRNELVLVSSFPLLYIYSAFKSTVFTLLRNKSEAIPDHVQTGFSFRTETYNPMQDPIPESYEQRLKLFQNETGSCPSQRMHSLLCHWFSAVILCSLYLVRLRSSTSLTGNILM